MKITRNQLRRLIKEEIAQVLEAEDPLDPFAMGSGLKPRPRGPQPIEPPKPEPTLPTHIKAEITSQILRSWEWVRKKGLLQRGGRFGFIVTVKSFPIRDGPDKGKFDVYMRGARWNPDDSNISRYEAEEMLKTPGWKTKDLGVSSELLSGEYPATAAG